MEVGVICARSEEPSAAASQPNVFNLSEKFPCMSGINLNLLCFARELPRAVANLRTPNGKKQAYVGPLAFGVVVVWILNLANPL